MKEKISLKEATDKVSSGMTVMIGGFMGCGSPLKTLDLLSEREDINDLKVITNDTSFENKGVGKLICNKKIKKLYASHIGLNPQSGIQLKNKELDVELIPQGTLAERIRAKGCGLGGVLTKTGLGTIIEENKQKVVIDGEEYLLEKPLEAEVALIYGSKVDKYGNVMFKGTTANFNVYMAMAAKTVIVEPKEFVDVLKPEEVSIPGMFIDYIVEV